MEYRRLGKSNLRVSALSLGSWVTFSNQADVDLALEMMTAAYDRGANFFDNAEVYAAGQSEIIMGHALKKAGWSRDSYIVSSKVFWGSVKNPVPTQHGLSRKHIVEAAHQALERLQVDYLDLYFCHRPEAGADIEEIVRAMTELIHRGVILYWGTSEWSAQELTEALAVARGYGLIPPTMEQPEYNMFHRYRFENEYERLYRHDVLGLGTTIWSPLASGLLTGKYNNGIPEDSRMNLPGYEWLKKKLEGEEGQAQLAKIKELANIAGELNTTLAKMALAWCLKNPNVSTVITGASKVSQVEENFGALDVVSQLTDDVMEKIEAVLDNKGKK
jgi:voltage-dependent potassium channel beta subunit